MRERDRGAGRERGRERERERERGRGRGNWRTSGRKSISASSWVSVRGTSSFIQTAKPMAVRVHMSSHSLLSSSSAATSTAGRKGVRPAFKAVVPSRRVVHEAKVVAVARQTGTTVAGPQWKSSVTSGNRNSLSFKSSSRGAAARGRVIAKVSAWRFRYWRFHNESRMSVVIRMVLIMINTGCRRSKWDEELHDISLNCTSTASSRRVRKRVPHTILSHAIGSHCSNHLYLNYHTYTLTWDNIIALL